MENRKNIDDLFREQLGDYAETPPPAAWGALEKKLKATPPGSSGNTRRITYAIITGCLLLLLAVSVTRKMPGLFHAGNEGDVTNVRNVENVHDVLNAPARQASKGAANSSDAGRATSGNTPANEAAGYATSPSTGNTAKTGAFAAAGNNANSNATSGTATGTKQNPVNNKQHISIAAKTMKRTSHSKPVAAIHKGISHSYFSSKVYSTSAKEQTGLENERMPEKVYGGTIAKPAAVNDNEVAAATENEEKTDANEPAPANQKTETPEKKKEDKQSANGNKPKQSVVHMPRFEAGVKVGFERGFNNDAGRKLVAGPYVQYKLNEKFALLTQPAFKTARVDTRNIGSPKSYYRANNDSTITPTDAPVAVHLGDGSTPFSVQHFRYSESHDSIVKTNGIGGAYYEVELPLLLKYKVVKGFSVYGGLNVVYSKLVAVTEHTYMTNVVQSQDNMVGYIYPDGSRHNLPPVNQVITFGGTPYSAYTGPEYSGTSGSEFRFGYMLGFSWDMGNRWLIDGLLQQTQTTTNYKAGYNVNTALTAPYFRFTIGYKLAR